MKIDIRFDSRSIQDFLEKVSAAELRKAVATSLNRTIVGARTSAAAAIRARIRLPANGREGTDRSPPGVSDMLDITKAQASRSGSLSDLEAKLTASEKPIPLIHFVRGKKEPASQLGKSLARRRAVRIMVRPGAVVKLKKGFIARARGGALNVFKRSTSASLPIQKQSIPSIAALLRKPYMIAPLRDLVGTRFNRELAHNLKFMVEQAMRKAGLK